MHAYMTTREVAQYLRLGERKIYELVAEGRIPFARITGKLLFPAKLVDLWVSQQVEMAPGQSVQAPPVLAGSHDPLLGWACRESACDLALLVSGSIRGLRRLADGSAMLAAVHAIDPEGGDYNVGALRREAPLGDAVLIEWARRRQGLAVAPANPLGIAGLAEAVACGPRLALRQPGSGAQLLLDQLARDGGFTLPGDGPVARSEADLAALVADGKADCGLCVEAEARRMRLGFVPLAWERFDLAMRRRDYFEPPLQKLLAFTRTPAFAIKAGELGGYDVAGCGQVRYNS